MRCTPVTPRVTVWETLRGVLAVAVAAGLTWGLAPAWAAAPDTELGTPDAELGTTPVRCGMRWLAAERAAGRLPVAPLTGGEVGGAARRAQAPAVQLGTELQFSLFTGGTVTATCRRVGSHSYVFVENRHWDTEGGSVLQSHVDALGELFDASTPADPERGLYDLETSVFGDVPDVDGDPRVFLVVLDIDDPNMVGYFDPNVAENLVPELRRDALFLDETFLRRRSRLALGTLAHEFQHLIHWGRDADEDPWVDEGLSGYAEELAGYPEADSAAVPEFLQQPWTSLTDWPAGNPARAYGGTYLFMSFLAERFGPPLLRPFVAQPRNGTAGLDAALQELGVTPRFADLWADWVVANYAATDERYAYSALAGRRVTPFQIEGLPVTDTRGSVPGRWATANVVFRTPGDIVVDFAGDAGGLFRVWAYAMGATGAELTEVELDADNRGSVQAAGIDSLALIVGRTASAAGGFALSARHETPTAVAAQLAATPGVVSLGRGYPNPFNGAVRIPYSAAADGTVELAVYDLAGQKVRHLRRGAGLAGSYEAVWDGRDDGGRAVASGTYLVRLRTVGAEAVTSLSLVR